MLFMDVDTAVSVPVNAMPLIDDTDFKTREEGISASDTQSLSFDLTWNFATTAGVLSQVAIPLSSLETVHLWSEVGDAMYQIALPSTGGTINNDTEGVGYFTGHATGILPWRGPDIVFRSGGLNDLLIDDPYQQGTVIGGGSGGGSITYEELRREVGRFLAIGESPVEWSSEDSVRVDDILKRGLNRFYFPEPSVIGDSALVGHNWSFLLTDLSVVLSTSSSYHTLPSDFVRMVGMPTISGSDYPLEFVKEKEFRNLLNIGEGQGYPQYYTIKRTLSSANLAYQIGLYPAPSSVYTLEGQYLFDPPDVSVSQDPVVTRPHNETLIAAVLATADEMMNYETQSSGVHQERFKTLLASSIISDQTFGGQ